MIVYLVVILALVALLAPAARRALRREQERTVTVRLELRGAEEFAQAMQKLGAAFAQMKPAMDEFALAMGKMGAAFGDDLARATQQAGRMVLRPVGEEERR